MFLDGLLVLGEPGVKAVHGLGGGTVVGGVVLQAAVLRDPLQPAPPVP